MLYEVNAVVYQDYLATRYQSEYQSTESASRFENSAGALDQEIASLWFAAVKH